jgi:phenylacetate-CoA ligase
VSWLLDRVYPRSPVWVQNAGISVVGILNRWHRYGSEYRAELGALVQRERAGRESMRVYQDARFRALVRVAFEKAPHWQELSRRLGLSAGDIASVDDLRRLPLLRKSELRAAPERFRTSTTLQRGWRTGRTSGTTGTPLVHWYDREIAILTAAVDRQHKLWAGARDRDWIGILYGRPVVPQGQQRPPFWRVNRSQHQVWFSSYHLRPDWLAGYLREIRRRGVRFLEGYPSALYALATQALDDPAAPKLDAVFTTAESLHPVQREAIESAFGCQVFDFYGSAERVAYAAECAAHAGLHLSEEYGFVEVVDSDGNPVPAGAPGLIVATALHNTAQPMFRLETGDVGSLTEEQCACGRTSRRLISVGGRLEDLLVTPSGRLISGRTITQPLKRFPEVAGCQIVQESPGEVLVRVIAPAGWPIDRERALSAEVAGQLERTMTVRVERVAALERTGAGKYRMVISRVPRPQRYEWMAPGE